MSIREERRTVGIAAAVLLLSTGPAGAVVVVGTGDPAIDVPAVQAAVDQGGTVTLSGTFDFGTHAGNHIIVPGRAGLDQDVRGQSTVFIYRADVTISGETDESGNPITVIRHGMPAFRVGWDGIVLRERPPGIPNVDFGIEIFPQDHDGRVRYLDTGPDPGYEGDQTRYAIPFPNVSATIQHIYFEAPWYYAVTASSGVNVTYADNVFHDVQWVTRIAPGQGGRSAGPAECIAAAGFMPCAARDQQPTRFTADHPFLFLIRDSATRSILFIGQSRRSEPVNPVPFGKGRRGPRTHSPEDEPQAPDSPLRPARRPIEGAQLTVHRAGVTDE